MRQFYTIERDGEVLAKGYVIKDEYSMLKCLATTLANSDKRTCYVYVPDNSDPVKNPFGRLGTAHPTYGWVELR